VRFNMPKTNYTKVEEMLNQSLHKIQVNHLLEEADEATKSQGSAVSAESAKKLSSTTLISSIQRDLKNLYKKDSATYIKLGIKKKYLKRWIETPEALTPEEMETLKQIQEKIKIFKEELKTRLPAIQDEAIVESQRTKHINKRYNVNEKWLPLQ
jgi:hypothetical protein